MKSKYDWLIVGGGIFGATFAYEMMQAGKSVLVVDRRDKMGGNVRCEKLNGVVVHKYGAHIFHTNSKERWDFVNSRVKLTPILHSPMAHTEDGWMLTLPFCMRTFNALWPEIITPKQAFEKITEQTKEWIKKYPNPTTLEQKALTLVGEDIYNALIKGYTQKQWNMPCDQLPAEIITRIPVRFTWDSSYFFVPYVGVPEEGYNPLIESLLDGADLITGTDYLKEKKDFDGLASKVLFTGCIDEYYGHSLGRLGYRSLRFDTKIEPLEDTQGCSVVNYTGLNVPYTRCIEHNQFAPKRYYEEVIKSYEYPADYTDNAEPYYPIVNEENRRLYKLYAGLEGQKTGVYFGGRLGLYEYMDMDNAIDRAQKMARMLLSGEKSPSKTFLVHE